MICSPVREMHALEFFGDMNDLDALDGCLVSRVYLGPLS